MTERDTRYLLRPGERTALPDRKLRLEPLPPPRGQPLSFGDIELQIERDGDRIVLWVIGMPLLTGSLDEAARLADVLGSIVGRP